MRTQISRIFSNHVTVLALGILAAAVATTLASPASACGGNQCTVGGSAFFNVDGITFGDGSALASAAGDQTATMAEVKAINLNSGTGEITGAFDQHGGSASAMFEGKASQVVLGLSHAAASDPHNAAAVVQNFSAVHAGSSGVGGVSVGSE